MRYDRLEQLKQKLLSMPKEKFNLGTWGIVGKVNGPAPSDNPREIIAWCGSTGCALGWAGSIKQFNREGFYTIIHKDNPRDLYPYYNGQYGFDAGAGFFGIHYQTSKVLFDPSHYPNYSSTTIQEVVDRIDMLLVCDEDTFLDMIEEGVI